jgi:hypothetical protein
VLEKCSKSRILLTPNALLLALNYKLMWRSIHFLGQCMCTYVLDNCMKMLLLK